MPAPAVLLPAAMLVHAFSHLLPHSDNGQSAYSSAATSAYIPDIPGPFHSAHADPDPADAPLAVAHRHLRRQRAAPYPSHPVQTAGLGHAVYAPPAPPVHMYAMHDVQSFPAAAHSLHSPQPMAFFNPVQHFSDSTVYASSPSTWTHPAVSPTGRIVRFNPTLGATSSYDGTPSYGSVEMYELTPKAASQTSSASSASLPSPVTTSGSYPPSFNGSSPATTPPLSAVPTSPSTALGILADAASAPRSQCNPSGQGQFVRSASPPPQMGPLGFPAPPMMPPIPPTLPPSHLRHSSSAPSDVNSNSELQNTPTGSGSMAPPQHTFPTPSELLGKLTAQDASELKEQRRQHRRKMKQEDAARTLGYLPTDPDAISTHDKKRFYLDCVEQYVIYLHEQLRLKSIEPVPVERVSSGRGLASRSIRTIIVHLQRSVQRLHDQRKIAEEQYYATRARLGIETDFLRNTDDDGESSSTSGPNLGRRHSISYIPTAQQYTFP